MGRVATHRQTMYCDKTQPLCMDDPRGLTRNCIGDSRFANFETDPKFRLPSKKHTKTKLDPRFSRLKSDPDFYNKASVDKYGRKISKDVGKKAIARLYEVDDEDEDEDVSEYIEAPSRR